MTVDETLYLLKEASTGTITCLLAILVFALTRYIYQNRLSISLEDRDVRDVALGLCLFFFGLTVSAAAVWFLSIANRHGWQVVESFDSIFAIFFVLFFGILGAMFTVKAFHEWPRWLLFVVLSVVIPLGIAFI